MQQQCAWNCISVTKKKYVIGPKMFFCHPSMSQHPQTPDWSGPDCKFEVSENNILFSCSLVLTDLLGKAWLTFMNITDH